LSRTKVLDGGAWVGRAACSSLVVVMCASPSWLARCRFAGQWVVAVVDSSGLEEQARSGVCVQQRASTGVVGWLRRWACDGLWVPRRWLSCWVLRLLVVAAASAMDERSGLRLRVMAARRRVAGQWARYGGRRRGVALQQRARRAGSWWRVRAAEGWQGAGRWADSKERARAGDQALLHC